MAIKCPNCHSEILDDSRFCSKCGTPIHATEQEMDAFTRTLTTPSAGISLGSLLAGKYRVLEEIGHGGMGVVYKAEDLKLKRIVAIKFLPRELSMNPEARERLIQEARAAAALSHPNICTIHEVDESVDKPFIVMEYVEGENLREKIKKGSLPIGEALDITIQAADGLEKAHQRGVVHRDIKSANIMVTASGQAKIMDFGLAKLRGGSAFTKEGTTLGTVAYMSPEQARGDKVDARTDLWSLGVVLYELASGSLPFRGDLESAVIHNILHEEPKPLRAILAKVPEEFERIIRRALKKKADDRYGSAAEMLADLRKLRAALEKERAGVLNLRSFLRVMRKPLVAVPAALVLIALGFMIYSTLSRQAKVRWAKDVSLPEITRLAYEGDYLAAFELASRAGKYIARDPRLVTAWPAFSRTLSVHTAPPGARIEMKRYLPTDRVWEYQGQTPVDGLRLPIGRYRMSVKMEGYVDVELAFLAVDTTMDIPLSRTGQFPEGMVRVPSGEYYLYSPGLDYLKAVKLDDYLIDKFEVTNKEYAEFVQSGGYEKREYWTIPFAKDGRVVPWDQAMTEFKDQTGRPGPASWEGGDYQKGKENYPVGGISWYEAAAYARYAGKNLPTVFHWNVAASPTWSADIIPLSNFQGAGPLPVGQEQGMSACGAFDMAGNVREWCWNDAGEGKYILGGGWNDPGYAFVDAYAQSAWDRSPANGFRCTKYLKEEANLADLRRPLVRAKRDYYKEKPVSDEIFKAFKRLYAYDKTELNPKIESEDSSNPDWIRQRISFDAAYGNERIIAALYLPKAFTPPFQVTVLFPGSNAIQLTTKGAIEKYGINLFDFVLKNGRAVLLPMYKGTFERGDALDSDYPSETAFYRDHVIMWSKDLGRSIDYLETRKDILSDKLAYFGFSWGGAMGAIMPAIEERLKLAILYVAGLDQTKAFPEADQINFLPRVTVPTLMLNGQYDFYFPVETSQKPMFDLLGTPPEHKRQVIYPSSHFAPRTELIKETLAWLDKYLGPVNK
jgi:formylglycine-generating enzyme required for sulfatase activity/predicted Ser/Thr protein kinase/dienelactone hydrolase